MNETRQYGVFQWRQDGQYPARDAIAVYKSEKLAQKRADAGYPDLVVRSIWSRANPPRRKAAGITTDDGRVIHKKLPPGTKLAGGRWDALSIWGDEMAIVHAPFYDSVDPSEFDPEHVAYKLVVFKSNIPASPRLVGSSADFPRNDLPWASQTFTYTPAHGMGKARGQLDKPIDYWVEYPKFSDLTPHQSRLVMDVLDRKGYAEEGYNYTVPASTWKKLLARSFEDIQNGDSDEANAAWAVVESRGYSSHGTMAGDSARWDALRGVYGVTKKGTIKFIVSRNPKGSGL
jgi:hypothetical protein